MNFLASGSLLPGIQRPDIVTLAFLEQKGKTDSTHMESRNCRLNSLGYKPGISTISGLGRAVLGLVHTIIHLVRVIFSENKAQDVEEAKWEQRML